MIAFGRLHHVSVNVVDVVAVPESPTGWRQIYVVDPDGNVIELNAEN